MLTRGGIRTIVGIVGNVISFGLFAAPWATIWRIYKNKDVEEFKSDPYIAAAMNCLFWVLYGLPWVHPNSTLVVTINGIGLVMEICYLAVFCTYGFRKHFKKVMILGCIELATVVLTGGLVIGLIDMDNYALKSKIVGAISVAFGIIMYGSPLTIMRKVIKYKSVEYMPFFLSLTCFLNGICWTTYALLEFDLFILIGNGVGGSLGLCQLILYAIYYRSTPKGNDKKKPSELQLPKVSV